MGNAKLTKVLESAINARQLRERFLADKTRPGYHFVVPEDIGRPGDVNCCFYARGRYHLMYLYFCHQDGFRYGHMSSIDLVHWRSHPDAVMPDEFDGGIFSGGAFVDDDGTCYISYWALEKEDRIGGVRLAKSSDKNYEIWEKFDDYVLSYSTDVANGLCTITDKDGKRRDVGCADPSNIWKKDGKYYMQHGNLPILGKYGIDGISGHNDPSNLTGVPEDIRGDWVDLFESDDLQTWRYLHRFYERKADNSWTNWNEDDMCPVFLPLPANENGGKESGKHLQLFISHNRGCQYYIGTYDKSADKLLLESHGRMSWADQTFFAPEALTAPDGRMIMWAWLNDDLEVEIVHGELGWAGVYGLPRSLWLKEDGTLGIAPIKELQMLRYNHMDDLQDLDPVSCEIHLEFDVEKDAKCGMYVYQSTDGSEYTKVYYDESIKALVMDQSHCGVYRRAPIERAPLNVCPGEKLVLNIFLDHSVVEIFANKTQAICRRVYTTKDDSIGMQIVAENCEVKKVEGWDMMPSNMY